MGKVRNEQLHFNNNGPPTLSKRLNGIVFQDCTIPRQEVTDAIRQAGDNEESLWDEDSCRLVLVV